MCVFLRVLAISPLYSQNKLVVLVIVVEVVGNQGSVTFRRKFYYVQVTWGFPQVKLLALYKPDCWLTSCPIAL